MTSVYEKSLELMDDYFDSVSAEEFLNDYLAVEEFKGPLVKDFLSGYSFSGHSYESCAYVNFELFGVETLFNAEINKFTSLTLCDKDNKCLIYKKRIDTTSDNTHHAANDNGNSFNLAA